jgi:hypothetical protein
MGDPRSVKGGVLSPGPFRWAGHGLPLGDEKQHLIAAVCLTQMAAPTVTEGSNRHCGRHRAPTALDHSFVSV